MDFYGICFGKLVGLVLMGWSWVILVIEVDLKQF
jgi:hypothetical protein